MMGAVSRPEIVTDRRFLISLQAAAAVHALAIFGWGLFPHDDVMTLPVKTLNIRIGSASEFLGKPAEPASSPSSGNASAAPAAVPSSTVPQTSKSTMTAALPTFKPKEKEPESVAQKTPEPKVEAAPEPKVAEPKAPVVEKRVPLSTPREMSEEELKKELSKPAAPKPVSPPTPPQPQTEASRLVRNNRAEAAAQASPSVSQSAGQQDTAASQLNAAGATRGIGQGGSAGAPTAQQAEVMARFEQVLSQWLQRHKKYPPEARAQRLEGQAVIRLRIDRMGNVKFYRLQQRTGHDSLDRAALEMVRAANPVPQVPDEYPAGTLLEFLVPVHFTLR
ncbi:MAG: energy transducer TonB [Alphaproteobacteria bacterium]|nr:energy transducer TonB [Alphaproteobacteria bacterium]